MLKAKIDEHTSLIVYSEWDSGTHKCFKAHTHREGEYCGESLNKHLTKEQIQEIELTIMSKLFSMVKGQ
ncbi:hypothetical protein [Aeromonas phage 4L372D]|uniref:Uncharacterized protein n=1 Tax=Aeromonas phage 4L372D TaxID=2588518 RepID=A0A5B9NAS6_9CAUD|nr:hypothetical protein HWC27_gp057 [Aeromonas phage 4L372D]QEG08521.1 hypothetical protein [Aeromonas phage 4L372D]